MKIVNKDIDVRDFVDPATGEIIRRYTYKRKACKRIPLESHLSRHLAGYTLIEKDLRSVLIWLREIESRHTNKPDRPGHRFGNSKDRANYDLIKGLFVAALTFYGKCFSQCEGRAMKLERVQIAEKYRTLHDTCVAYRHNFAAHSGAAKLETVEIVIAYTELARKRLVYKVFRELNQPDVLWPPEEEITLIELVEHARQVAISKIERLADKIEREEVFSKLREHL